MYPATNEHRGISLRPCRSMSASLFDQSAPDASSGQFAGNFGMGQNDHAVRGLRILYHGSQPVDTELVTLTRSVVEQFVCIHDFSRLHRPESCNSDTKRETPAPLPFLPDGSRHGSARTGNAPRRGFPCTTAIHGPRPRIGPDFRTVAGLFAAQPTNKPELPGEQRTPEKTNKRRYSPPDAERQNRRSVPLRRAICSQTSDCLPGAFAAMRSQTQVG